MSSDGTLGHRKDIDSIQLQEYPIPAHVLVLFAKITDGYISSAAAKNDLAKMLKDDLMR